jgi:hypothetical protein
MIGGCPRPAVRAASTAVPARASNAAAASCQGNLPDDCSIRRPRSTVASAGGAAAASTGTRTAAAGAAVLARDASCPRARRRGAGGAVVTGLARLARRARAFGRGAAEGTTAVTDGTASEAPALARCAVRAGGPTGAAGTSRRSTTGAGAAGTAASDAIGVGKASGGADVPTGADDPGGDGGDAATRR